MRPYHFFHHPPDGFGFWHGGWLALMSLVTPLLLALPLLALLGLVLWLSRRGLLDQFGGWLPAGPGRSASAVETLRQRYARGEIDDDTYATMLDRLNSAIPDQPRAATDDDAYRVNDDERRFRARPDVPVDWS